MVQTIIVIIIVVLAALLALWRARRVFIAARQADQCTPEHCAHCSHAAENACTPGNHLSPPLKPTGTKKKY